MKTPRLHKLLLGLFASATLAVTLPGARAANYSLAGDFSYASNPNGVWSYHVDDWLVNPPTFPLLTDTSLNANTMWGLDFPNPPLMWSQGTGFWGIGKNTSGVEQIASGGVTWRVNEVLLHPRFDHPGRLVIAWTAPGNLVIDVHYTFARGMSCGNGVGYQLLKRSGGVDTVVEEFGVGGTTAGGPITRSQLAMAVSTGDQLFFRVDAWGNAGCDITKASIEITESPTEGPSLGIEKARLLSWSVFPPGYKLHVAPAPEGPYEPVTDMPALENGRYKLTVGPETLYYKLIPAE